jgi:putative ABC transport system permease protein
MGSLMQDVRYAVRMLLKSPGFTIVAVLTLALGIGANSAIFSVIDSVLLRPLPFPNSSRLVWAWGRCPLCDGAAVSPGDFPDYRAQNHVFEHFGAIAAEDSLSNLSGSGDAIQVRGAMITADFLEAVGIQPAYGRSFVLADEQTEIPQVVILSHRLWQNRFSSDPNAVGQTISLDGKSNTIVGVLARDYPILSKADLWYPAPFRNGGMSSRRSHFLRPIGLLRPGVSISQAQSELDTIAARLSKAYPDTNTDWGLKLEDLHTVLIGDVKPAFAVLLGAVALVLLIACANVASLLLARNSMRTREFAVRTALGAARSRLVRQLLTESILLAGAGGLPGLLLSNAAIALLKAWGPASLPRLEEISLSAPVVAFTAAVTIGTGILFGLGPSLRASRRDLSLSLKEGGRSGDSHAKHRAHDVLVVAEVALAMIVLIASGLLLNSFWRLIHVNAGFDPSNVVTTELSLISPRYDPVDRREAFFHELQDRVQNLPGVESAGYVSELPLSNEADDTFFTIAEHPPANPNDKNDADIRIVDGQYFHAMRIPLLAGRDFTREEANNSAGVIIVNAPFVKKFFPHENPIGMHLAVFEGKPEFVNREIIGVVGGNKHFTLQEDLRPEMFTPGSFETMNLVVRSTSAPTAIVPAIRDAVHQLDSGEATAEFRTMDDVVASSASGDRFNAFLLGAFGGMALLLTAAGIFGVLSYLVTQRSREIGIRMALGAQRSDVLRVILGHGMRMALIGVCIGVAGALAVTHWMSSVLFNVKPFDPLTIAAVTFVIAFVAFLACYVPSRRATRVDPLIALRYE